MPLRRNTNRRSEMYRVTTPTHTFKLPINTSDCSEIQLTYKQGSTVLVKHYQDGILPDGMTLDDEQVIQILTQEETKAFKEGTASVQVRVLLPSGKSYASQTFSFHVSEVLNDEVLS